MKEDRADKETIIISDKGCPETKTVKKVIIITPSGDKKMYEIKRTSKGGYLFN